MRANCKLASSPKTSSNQLANMSSRKCATVAKSGIMSLTRAMGFDGITKNQRRKTNANDTWLNSHLIYASLVRLILLLYSVWHDKNFIVKYTDIDYTIFSDAANYVVEGKSPYLRSTYRYTPILAWILTLNITIHPVLGKLIFAVGDIANGYLIYRLLVLYSTQEKFIRYSLIVWLYNPLTMIISTRGSADSLVTCLVLSTLFLLQTNKFVLAGIIYGLAIHFKLYPIIYCLSLYLSLECNYKNEFKIDSVKNLVYYCYFLFRPNLARFKFTLTTLVTLISLTGFCYFLYGDIFLKEALFYHVIRKDVRHNFSVYFYLLYLLSDYETPFISLIVFLPQFLLLLVVSFKFSHKNDLAFCLFIQTYIFVTFNKVCTSQYFLWYISLLPLVLFRLKLTLKQFITCAFFWLISQCIWLLFAYLLEFKGWNTFLLIWIAGLIIFVVNVKILAELINAYK